MIIGKKDFGVYMRKFLKAFYLATSSVFIFALLFATSASELAYMTKPTVSDICRIEGLSAASADSAKSYITSYVSVRVLMDNSYQSFYGANSNTQVSSDISYIGFPFGSTWNIIMSYYVGTVSPLLPDYCVNGYLAACDNDSSTCGTYLQCLTANDTTHHHKSHSKNLNYFSNNVSSSGYDLMLLLQAIPYCGLNTNLNMHVSGSYSSSGYSGVVGQAQVLGQYSVVTMLQSQQHLRIRTMQHEISHNFGCHDGVCPSNATCIMSGGYDNTTILLFSNIWCSVCSQDFNPAAH